MQSSTRVRLFILYFPRSRQRKVRETVEPEARKSWHVDTLPMTGGLLSKLWIRRCSKRRGTSATVTWRYISSKIPRRKLSPPNFYNIISAEKIRAGVSQNFAAKNFGTNEDCHREGVSVSGEFSGMENSKPKSLRAVSFDAGASRFVYPSTDQQGNLRLLRKRSRIRVQLFRYSVRGFYLRFLKSTKRCESLSRTGTGNLLIESPASIRSRSLLW